MDRHKCDFSRLARQRSFALKRTEQRAAQDSKARDLSPGGLSMNHVPSQTFHRGARCCDACTDLYPRMSGPDRARDPSMAWVRPLPAHPDSRYPPMAMVQNAIPEAPHKGPFCDQQKCCIELALAAADVRSLDLGLA